MYLLYPSSSPLLPFCPSKVTPSTPHTQKLMLSQACGLLKNAPTVPLSLANPLLTFPSGSLPCICASAALPLAPMSARITALYKNYTYTLKAPLKGRYCLFHLFQELILNKSDTSQTLNK